MHATNSLQAVSKCVASFPGSSPLRRGLVHTVTVLVHVRNIFVTRWVKTWHIPHFMKIDIRPEIGISMFNCAAVKKWKRSVAWFLSYGAKRIVDTECQTQCFYVVTVNFNVVLRKIDLCSCKKAARKSAKTVWKDSGGESGGLHCLYKQKDNHIQAGSLWNCLFWKRVL